MANNMSSEDAIRPVTTQIGHPAEPLEIEQGHVSEEEINYPTGHKLWLTVATLCVTMFLKGLVS
jgi:hypothetical protein